LDVLDIKLHPWLVFIFLYNISTLKSSIRLYLDNVLTPKLFNSMDGNPSGNPSGNQIVDPVADNPNIIPDPLGQS